MVTGRCGFLLGRPCRSCTPFTVIPAPFSFRYLQAIVQGWFLGGSQSCHEESYKCMILCVLWSGTMACCKPETQFCVRLGVLWDESNRGRARTNIHHESQRVPLCASLDLVVTWMVSFNRRLVNHAHDEEVELRSPDNDHVWQKVMELELGPGSARP